MTSTTRVLRHLGARQQLWSGAMVATASVTLWRGQQLWFWWEDITIVSRLEQRWLDFVGHYFGFFPVGALLIKLQGYVFGNEYGFYALTALTSAALTVALVARRCRTHPTIDSDSRTDLERIALLLGSSWIWSLGSMATFYQALGLPIGLTAMLTLWAAAITQDALDRVPFKVLAILLVAACLRSVQVPFVAGGAFIGLALREDSRSPKRQILLLRIIAISLGVIGSSSVLASHIEQLSGTTDEINSSAIELIGDPKLWINVVLDTLRLGGVWIAAQAVPGLATCQHCMTTLASHWLICLLPITLGAFSLLSLSRGHQGRWKRLLLTWLCLHLLYAMIVVGRNPEAFQRSLESRYLFPLAPLTMLTLIGILAEVRSRLLTRIVLAIATVCALVSIIRLPLTIHSATSIDRHIKSNEQRTILENCGRLPVEQIDVLPEVWPGDDYNGHLLCATFLALESRGISALAERFSD